MLKIKYTLFFLSILCIASCTKDKETETPVIVTTNDLQFTIEETPEVDALIGELNGTTNSGTVSFTISSQIPEGAVAIGGDSNSSLVVADASLFNFATNPEITAVIDVTSGAVTEQSNVTITVTEAPVDCSNATIDLSAFAKDGLYVASGPNDDDGFPNETNLGANFTGVVDACSITISGDDILGLCSETTEQSLKFSFPEPEDDLFLAFVAAGQLEIEDYGCGITDVFIDGLFDAENNLLLLTWEYTDMNGDFFFGSSTISLEEQ